MTARLVPLIVVAAALGAGWPALEGGFVYDDKPYVVDNPAVVGDASPWTDPLGEDSQGLWRPVTVATFRAQWPAGAQQANARPFRLVNLLLHAAAALAVLGLARRLGAGSAAAALAAVVFAVHPAHAEAVAWVAGRAELLATLLLLLAWRLHLARGALAAAAAPVAVVLACLSKETALVAPALFVVGDLVVRPREVPWGRLLASTVAVAAVLLARAALLPYSLPTDAPYADLELPARVVVALNILARTLQLLAWPHPLRVFYHRDEFTEPATATIVTLLAALVVAALAWRRARLVAVGLALVPISLATVLNLVPIGETFAERFLMLPSVGFSIAVGVALAALARAELRSRGRLGVGALLPLALVTAAIPTARAAHATFHSDLELWAHAARVTPDLAHARYNHGYFLTLAGLRLRQDVDLPGGLDELRASLRLQPDHRYAPFAHLMLGNEMIAVDEITGGMVDPTLAAHHFRRAVELMPELIAPRVNLASLAVAEPTLVTPDEGRALLEPLLRSSLAGEERAAIEALMTDLGG